MSKERFKDAEWFTYLNQNDNYKPIVLGGVGGIGSYLSLFLTRIGFNVYAYDMDKVDQVNLGGQLYGVQQLNKPKVDAIYEVLQNLTEDVKFRGYNRKYNDVISPIMCSAFDNMEARKQMFKAWEEQKTPNKLFVDGRMEAETGMIFFVTPDKIDAYKEHLFDDAEIPDLQCSYKSTSHNGAMIASYMTSGINNWLTNLANGFELRDVPFKISYELMMFTQDVHEKEHKI